MPWYSQVLAYSQVGKTGHDIGGRRLLLVGGMQVHRETAGSKPLTAVREQEIEINAPDLGHSSLGLCQRQELASKALLE